MRKETDERETEIDLAHSGMVSSEQDKFMSLVNILRGSEEFTLNPDGVIIGSNLEAVSITGYEEWEVIGKHCSMFYTEEDRALNKPWDDLQSAVATGRAHILGWRVKKRNTTFWAKVKLRAVFDQEGELHGFHMVLRDATHKAMSSYRVKRIRSEYFNLFNNPFIGIFKFRLDDCRVLLFNEKALDIFGLEGIEGLSFEQLFAQPAAFDEFLDRIVSGKKLVGFDFQVACPSGEERWVSISCSYFEEGHFVEGVVMDISEKKKQVLELQRLNHELDQFIYHASHDLRSPLTTLLGLVNLIELDQPTKSISLYADMLKERIEYLDALLKDLVFITVNGKSELESKVMHLEPEVNAILKEFQDRYPKVRIYLNQSGDCEFYTDPIRFRTVLRGLISNALKYHNVHAESPYLKIEIGCTHQSAHIRFEDNGIGIEEEHMPRIFNMFFRATPKPHGTGLGLYIVKLMVDKLGGQIQVTSVRGKGTTFHLELPNRINKIR